MRIPILLSIALWPGVAAAAPVQLAAPALTYADLADLAIPAPVVAEIAVRDAIALKGVDATGVPAGKRRFYVEADVTALLRGAGGVPPSVRYLVDLPLDSRGRAPKLVKARLLLFAAPIAGRPGELRLTASDAQLAGSDELAARVRAILTATTAADAPPVVTGIARAFHVAGSLPGEGETQIFLTTADDRPVSLNILRRPGEQPRWAAALGEIVDEAAAPPAPDSLLWYRLACFLPPALPDASTGDSPATDAAQAREDYKVVIAGLGPCARTRG